MRTGLKTGSLILGLVSLAIAWIGLPLIEGGSFTLHMLMHMTVVAVAAPLLAVSFSPQTANIQLAAAPGMALLASVTEFFVVWGWHAPALHHAARGSGTVMALEQGCFLAAGLLLWGAATASGGSQHRQRTAAGVVALLVTAMHMTLLGTLLALAPRPLYVIHHSGAGAFGLTPLQDQQLGGTVMLTIGGIAYVSGGVVLMLRLLRQRHPASPAGETP